MSKGTRTTKPKTREQKEIEPKEVTISKGAMIAELELKITKPRETLTSKRAKIM
jgi:hypothetical protein